jgi:hypothetical protein
MPPAYLAQHAADHLQRDVDAVGPPGIPSPMSEMKGRGELALTYFVVEVESRSGLLNGPVPVAIVGLPAIATTHQGGMP